MVPLAAPAAALPPDPSVGLRLAVVRRVLMRLVAAAAAAAFVVGRHPVLNPQHRPAAAAAAIAVVGQPATSEMLGPSLSTVSYSQNPQKKNLAGRTQRINAVHPKIHIREEDEIFFPSPETIKNQSQNKMVERSPKNPCRVTNPPSINNHCRRRAVAFGADAGQDSTEVVAHHPGDAAAAAAAAANASCCW